MPLLNRSSQVICPRLLARPAGDITANSYDDPVPISALEFGWYGRGYVTKVARLVAGGRLIEKGDAMEIIGVIVAGIIIGLLGKFVAPGSRDNTPLWLTILCGIGGVLIGWFIYTAFGGNGSPGIDWVRWLIAIAVAAVLVVIASTVTGRNTTTRV
jgi:uncharacterized membrane protein YeaQ/YmgE (transglycosylase-associated protein family)